MPTIYYPCAHCGRLVREEDACVCQEEELPGVWVVLGVVGMFLLSIVLLGYIMGE